jgi:hypothetical protein
MLIRNKSCGRHQAKRRKEENPHISKPEGQEGLPQHQHYPLANRREDRNPKYHKEQQEDVA